MQSSTHYVYSVQENGAFKAFAVDGRHNAVGNILTFFACEFGEKKDERRRMFEIKWNKFAKRKHGWWIYGNMRFCLR